MLRRSHILASLLVALLVSGCDGVTSESTFDVSAYVGTYTGTRAVIDAGSRDTENVTFAIATNDASRTVTLTLTPESGPPEVLTGAYNDGGIDISTTQSGITIGFSVLPDESIVGTFSAFGQTGTISGTLTPTRFDLTFTPTDPDGARTEIRTSR